MSARTRKSKIHRVKGELLEVDGAKWKSRSQQVIGMYFGAGVGETSMMLKVAFYKGFVRKGFKST